MEERRVKLLDVVELRAASGRWPVGQVGTVVEDFGHSVLIEISDECGRGLDFLELPPDAVASVPDAQQERLVLS